MGNITQTFFFKETLNYFAYSLVSPPGLLFRKPIDVLNLFFFFCHGKKLKLSVYKILAPPVVVVTAVFESDENGFCTLRL